ncbi:MAG: RNA polymerase sigma factor [Kofleriaceae bacterium]
MKLLSFMHRPVPPVEPDVLAALLPKVRRWVHRILGPNSALDDVAQDALIEIAKALPAFRGDSAVDTFAYRITIRVATKALRRRRDEIPLELVPPQADHIDPESQLAHRELMRALYRALDELPTRLRLTFVLCELEGMTPTEASVVLNEGAATVRSRLRRARESVTEKLRADHRLAWLEGVRS